MDAIRHPPGAFVPSRRQKKSFDNPFIVHQTEGRSTDSLIVLVHGLHGDPVKTWGHYPDLLLNDETVASDVCTFEYETGFWRRPWRPVRLESQAEALSNGVRELSERMSYRRIALMGHSLGGVLCKLAIANMLDVDERDDDGRRRLDQIAALIMIASPQAGTGAVPKILTKVSQDARALRLGSKLTGTNARKLSDRLQTDIHVVGPSWRPKIPAFAVTAANDLWVDTHSAGLNIGPSQRHTAFGSHSGVLGAADRSDDVYGFISRSIARCREMSRTGDRTIIDPGEISLEQARLPTQVAAAILDTFDSLTRNAAVVQARPYLGVESHSDQELDPEQMPLWIGKDDDGAA